MLMKCEYDIVPISTTDNQLIIELIAFYIANQTSACSKLFLLCVLLGEIYVLFSGDQRLLLQNSDLNVKAHSQV